MGAGGFKILQEGPHTALLRLSESGEKLCAMFLLAAVMILSGLISPRLPFNRHTGLRLPWTVQDEDTWNVAHRILGYTAVPPAVK